MASFETALSGDVLRSFRTSSSNANVSRCNLTSLIFSVMEENEAEGFIVWQRSWRDGINGAGLLLWQRLGHGRDACRGHFTINLIYSKVHVLKVWVFFQFWDVAGVLKRDQRKQLSHWDFQKFKESELNSSNCSTQDNDWSSKLIFFNLTCV